MKHANDYIHNNGSQFEAFDSVGFTSIRVLEFLHGKLWDDIALGYVHALRPSTVRISHGAIKCDARTWRVTVYIDDNDRIEYIEQEVEVGLPHGIDDGYDLDCQGLK